MSAAATAATPPHGLVQTNRPGLLARSEDRLFTCPREIWIAFLIKVLESLCCFSSVLMLMIFLTQDMGLSDKVAGTIFGVFSASMFFAEVGAGPITGILLANLCPAEGARNTELMWIIVGASTMISPIALFFGRRWLDVESRERAGADLGRSARKTA